MGDLHACSLSVVTGMLLPVLVGTSADVTGIYSYRYLGTPGGLALCRRIQQSQTAH